MNDLNKLNEAIQFFEEKIKSQGMITDARDEDHLKRLKELRDELVVLGNIYII